MTDYEFKVMMERNFTNFDVPKDIYGGLLLWIPQHKEFLSMHFGDGTNSDSLEDGCEDYIYYTQYDFDFDCDDVIEMEETDGGQMDIPSVDTYDCNISDAIHDMLLFIYEELMEVVPIKFYRV